ncbi:hypothetical protein HYV44_01850 [Candidatus Microgenomates bacterium]|nr:hypothetical protein [Candidatus Microgenomates bacterium]
MITKKIFLLFFVFTLFLVALSTLALPTSILAADTPTADENLQEIEKANRDKDASGSNTLTNFVKVFYAILSRIVILAALLAGVIGGYIYMSSSGNPEKIGQAKDIITRAILGLVVVALAYAFFRIIAPDIIS